MSEKFYNIEGRSLLINIILILINLTGLTMLTMGFHDNFEDQKLTLTISGSILLVLSAVGILILKGKLLFSYISRVIVGGIFIVSGLIKANDPLGFSYKLEEYFEDGALAYRIKEWFSAPAFTLEYLIDYALIISVIVCILEIVVGVMLIIGGKIKLMSWLLMASMFFFTFLTWHTANCDSEKKFIDRDRYEINSELATTKIEASKSNKDIKIVSKDSQFVTVDELKSPQCVKDCGCFGDAMKGSVGRSLTPKESLWKDYVLLYLGVWIFISQFIIQPNTKKQNFVVIGASILVIGFFSFVFGWFAPILFGIISILLALWIKIAGGKILGNHWGSALIVTIICALFTTYVLMYEPIKDYRPYAVGSDLNEKMNDGIAGEFKNIFILFNKKTGKEEEWTEQQYTDVNRKIWEDPNYEYRSMISKEVKLGKLPSITEQFGPSISVYDLSDAERKLKPVTDFILANSINGVLLLDKKYKQEIQVAKSEYNTNDYDTTNYVFINNIEMLDPEVSEIQLINSILTDSITFIVVSKDLKKADFSEIEKFKELQKEASKRKISFYMITSNTREDINQWRKEHDFDIPVFINDGTELKVIARSNPALVVISKGKVIGKFPHRSLPTFKWLENHTLSK